ncbi:MAG: DUF2752 domain-containing protein [Saprospiraceae bacterium]|nr:DUF2752 domain-containing protein [Saprospiraceae bacterium]
MIPSPNTPPRRDLQNKYPYLNLLKKGSAILLFALPFLLLVLPSDYFDKGQSLCLSVVLFEQECPACGLTRALMHLIHMDWEGAYALNKMSFVIFPLLCYLWCRLCRQLWNTTAINPDE